MTEPWQCPSCKTWMAPGITEHRCEGDGGVPAVPVIGPTFGPSTTTSSTATEVTHIHVHGSAVSERDLMRAVQRASRWNRS